MCENVHKYSLKDVKFFSRRLNALEMRCDGQDQELNKIMEAAHSMLQFIVDMVTNDSVLYMAIGDGLVEQELINDSEDDANDVRDNGKDNESEAKENNEDEEKGKGEK